VYLEAAANARVPDDSCHLHGRGGSIRLTSKDTPDPPILLLDNAGVILPPAGFQSALLHWIDREAYVGIFTTDAALVIQSWNAWLTRTTGIQPHDAIGRMLVDIYPEIRTRGLDRCYERALQGEPSVLSYSLHKYLFKLDWHGADMGQNCVIAPLVADDAPIGTVTVIENVSDRVQREAQWRLDMRILERAVQDRTDALMREIEERRAAEARLADVMRRMLSAQEDERHRIARDLHDDLGQHMTALHLKLEVLRRSGVQEPTWQSEFVAVQDYVRQFERDLDSFTSQLRAGGIYALGLAPALADLVHQWSKTYRVAAQFEQVGFDGARLTSDIETSLYRIAQEALTNIAKHAQPTSVSVVLQRTATSVVLCVEDDGIGFDYGRARTERRGLGLAGIKERAALLNGLAEIETAPEGGTAVIVTVPADRHKLTSTPTNTPAQPG
jgi:PAS domain S-box-containing protein